MKSLIEVIMIEIGDVKARGPEGCRILGYISEITTSICEIEALILVSVVFS